MLQYCASEKQRLLTKPNEGARQHSGQRVPDREGRGSRGAFPCHRQDRSQPRSSSAAGPGSASAAAGPPSPGELRGHEALTARGRGWVPQTHHPEVLCSPDEAEPRPALRPVFVMSGGLSEDARSLCCAHSMAGAQSSGRSGEPRAGESQTAELHMPCLCEFVKCPNNRRAFQGCVHQCECVRGLCVQCV